MTDCLHNKCNAYFYISQFSKRKEAIQRWKCKYDGIYVKNDDLYVD